MDLFNTIVGIILGFLSLNIVPSNAQWGLQWGWLPGSMGNLRPIRLVENLKSKHHGRILWSLLNNDLILERDSSDSSDSSDEYKKKFIKKLKRRLSKKKKMRSRRKSANVMIEKLIKDKLLSSSKVNRDPNGKSNTKPKPEHIHTIDKGTNQVKAISKNNLVPTLRNRLLPDYDYGTTITPFRGTKEQAVGSTSSTRKANHHGDPEIEVEEEQTDISHIGSYTTEEPELEEVTQNTTERTKVTTGEQEVELEETTTQSVSVSTVSSLPVNSTTTTSEQEIEAEETTTVVSSENVVTTTKATNGEQEIEAEDITTQSTQQSPVSKTTAADHEIEAEETTSQATTTATTVKALPGQSDKTTTSITPIFSSGKTTNRVGLQDKTIETSTQESYLPPPVPIISIDKGTGLDRKVFPLSVPKQTSTGHLSPSLGQSVISNAGNSVSVPSLREQTLDPSKNKLGSGRRRVDDNGKKGQHPSAASKGNEVLTFSGRVIDNRKAVHGHAVLSQNKPVYNLPPNQKSVIKMPTQSLPTTNQNEIVKGEVVHGSIPVGKNVVFQKHGITILKPIKQLLRKNEKVLSQSPFKSTVTVKQHGDNTITGSKSQGKLQRLSGHSAIRQGLNEHNLISRKDTGQSGFKITTINTGANTKPEEETPIFVAGTRGKSGNLLGKNELHLDGGGTPNKIAQVDRKAFIKPLPTNSDRQLGQQTGGAKTTTNPDGSSLSKSIISWQHKASSNGVIEQSVKTQVSNAQNNEGSIKSDILVAGGGDGVNRIQWGPVATSNPMSAATKAAMHQDPIKWEHRATSKPVYPSQIPSTETFKQEKENILWGPKATSGPVSNERLSTKVPTKGASSSIQSNVKIEAVPIAKGLFDRLRTTTRNLGSNRGRVTISDVGNSSKVLPLSNGHVKNTIQNKIHADETMTKQWIQTKQREAVDLAAELEGTWKDVNTTRIGHALSKCPAYKIRYQANSVILDTVDNKCRTVITWHKKTKREQIRENTWYGTNVSYRERPYYVPVVTYMDLAKV